MDYIIADNYLCFLALLEMILRAKGIIISQYDLAEKYGVTVPIGYVTNIKNVKYSAVQDDLGVIITPKSLQQFLNDLNCDMEVSFLSALHTNEFELGSILRLHLAKGKFVIFAFSYGVLYSNESYYDLGHVSLLHEIVNDDLLQIYDPGPDSPGIKNAKISDMYDAMRKKGGIYILG